jgi:hypothetical protein
MSDPEVTPTLPAKIGSMAMHALNIVKENIIAPATEMDEEHETTGSVTASNDTPLTRTLLTMTHCMMRSTTTTWRGSSIWL